MFRACRISSDDSVGLGVFGDAVGLPSVTVGVDEGVALGWSSVADVVSVGVSDGAIEGGELEGMADSGILLTLRPTTEPTVLPSVSGTNTI